ncbi:hypothetical protein Q0F99_02220 [Rathayibacter oskolensis]|uniref:hypothetical protein n=1 Tax=Rathayibacter TaxID=33886 RepID=UPI00131839B0|nr:MULTISPECIES: hypothetical protein [Rathayibacter]QHC67418.1 hypothetical protein GSU68_13150 [Rathayibacter sp. VKM Ac-2759]WKK71962.1 hypothetical protein Q0F99_02220 [Rathayibacter oskolensis]
MPSFRSTVLALAAAAALVGAAATPALADHNAGANLDGYASSDISSNGSCYYGALLPGSPDISLSTTSYRFVRAGASLTLVCSYTGIPSFIPGTEQGDGGDWYAPKKPTRYTAQDACLPPGVDSAGELYPDDENRPVDKVDAKTLFYRSTMTMVCFWPDDPTR